MKELSRLSDKDIELRDTKGFWDNLLARHEWCRDMEACPQDSKHHAEGNVLVHSRMVYEAMLLLPEWERLGEHDKLILRLAVALHDVGKPPCTVEGEEGIVSPKHAVVGSKMARLILSDVELPHGVRDRETVVGLIRCHGVPHLFLDRPDPLVKIIETSFFANNPLLYLLARSDHAGRTRTAHSDRCDEIELFKDFCIEHKCWYKQREFPSEHSRVMYFKGRHGALDYPVYDTTKFKVTMMCGLPGAGKDTWIRGNMKDSPVVSLDNIRAEMGVDPEDNQGTVIQNAKEAARVLLREGRDFVFNATNVVYTTRRGWEDLFMSYGARVEIVYVDPGFQRVLSMNRDRKNKVPEDVISSLFYKMDMPTLIECHSLVRELS